jgi:hypothetical protein
MSGNFNNPRPPSAIGGGGAPSFYLNQPFNQPTGYPSMTNQQPDTAGGPSRPFASVRRHTTAQKIGRQRYRQKTKSKRNQVCANCFMSGHSLRHCFKADPDGFLSGCPRCDDFRHDYDQCHEVKQPKDDLLFLVKHRSNKPLIRSQTDIRTVEGFYDKDNNVKWIPWTPDFTKKFMAERPEYYREHKFKEKWQDEEYTEDPSWQASNEGFNWPVGYLAYSYPNGPVGPDPRKQREAMAKYVALKQARQEHFSSSDAPTSSPIHFRGPTPHAGTLYPNNAAAHSHIIAPAASSSPMVAGGNTINVMDPFFQHDQAPEQALLQHHREQTETLVNLTKTALAASTSSDSNNRKHARDEDEKQADQRATKKTVSGQHIDGRDHSPDFFVRAEKVRQSLLSGFKSRVTLVDRFTLTKKEKKMLKLEQEKAKQEADPMEVDDQSDVAPPHGFNFGPASQQSSHGFNFGATSQPSHGFNFNVNSEGSAIQDRINENSPPERSAKSSASRGARRGNREPKPTAPQPAADPTKPSDTPSRKRKVPDYLASYHKIGYEKPVEEQGRSNSGMTYRDFVVAPEGGHCKQCGCLEHSVKGCKVFYCGKCGEMHRVDACRAPSVCKCKQFPFHKSTEYAHYCQWLDCPHKAEQHDAMSCKHRCVVCGKFDHIGKRCPEKSCPCGVGYHLGFKHGNSAGCMVCGQFACVVHCETCGLSGHNKNECHWILHSPWENRLPAKDFSTLKDVQELRCPNHQDQIWKYGTASCSICFEQHRQTTTEQANERAVAYLNKS